MKYLKTVFVYRYDEKENIWEKNELENVLVSGSSEIYNLSDTLNRDARVILRVMGNDSADVLPQDVISLKNTEGITPPDDALVVVAASKNQNGTSRVRHTKIVCK